MANPGLQPRSLALMGVGAAALLVAGWAWRRAAIQAAAADSRAPPHRVVVVGAGFGGLQAALELAGRPGVDLTVIDSHNHHLFQPLLYQVATAALSPEDIASPVRGILPGGDHTRVLMDTVTGVDTTARQVVMSGGDSVPYDELIIATGSETSYFGNDGWARAAPGLKSLQDALGLRQRILSALERAAETASEAERARLLTFVLIGGGPTGVEMAGSIAELTRQMLARDYGGDPDQARVVLIEAGPRLLPAFAPDLSQAASRALATLGVEVRLGARVTGIEHDAVHLHDGAITAETIVWTAGTAATPVAGWLGLHADKGGRVAVADDLRVAGFMDVRVIGDAALARGADGKPLPGLAPVAKQQGHYVARAILRRLQGRRPLPPFAYRDYGTLATIGRNRAVAEFGPVHLTGTLAWVTWAVAHIFFLIGFRNRVMVSAQWAFAYATNNRSGRLIIGRSKASHASVLPPPSTKAVTAT